MNIKICWILLGMTGFLLPLTGLADKKNNDPELALARQLENAFVKVAEQASQSVVVITTLRNITAGSGPMEGMEGFEGTPFEFFFQRRGMPPDHPREVDSQGSGILLKEDGYILTNHHVVEGVKTIKVRLKDGREFDGKLIGGDPRTDVSVIKIEGKNLPAAKLGNSDKVKPGQWAVAIGAPFQLDYSFTVGFVSATGRQAVWSRSGSAYEDYIQTDASINPGNSGGPLCNIEGEVIGINTLIRGMNRGIGFAIPINQALAVANQLIEKGRVVRPWLGISIEALSANKELLDKLKDVITDGVVVRSIYPDTPASRSELKPLDIITNVDGVSVKTPRELQQQILKKNIGDKVRLDVVREGKPTKIELSTGELPSETEVAARESPEKPKTETGLGITVQPLTPELAEQFNAPNTDGVVIMSVADNTPAAARGLKPGDVITEVNRQPVKTPEEFAKAVAGADLKKGVLLYIRRDGAASFIVLRDSR